MGLCLPLLNQAIDSAAKMTGFAYVGNRLACQLPVLGVPQAAYRERLQFRFSMVAVNPSRKGANWMVSCQTAISLLRDALCSSSQRLRGDQVVSNSQKKIWFRVKRHGYGVGLPIAWEGWFVLTLYIGAIVLSAALYSELASLAVLILLTPILLAVAYVRSDDEWRWRDGS